MNTTQSSSEGCRRHQEGRAGPGWVLKPVYPHDLILVSLEERTEAKKGTSEVREVLRIRECQHRNWQYWNV